MRPLALFLALAVTSRASAAAPTCALLDPDKTPRAALLEAKLLAEPGATWVERTDIDKVLKEQQLQAAFGPQGVGERVRLGKLLKADLLVMVRPVKGAERPAIEVVVSETASGLRLLLRGVPVTSNADEDVALLLAAAKDGIRRHAEKIEHVVAVPPFVSNDLGYQFDHLKGAYAKLAESVALDRKGVVVVELEEAQALAKEQRLAAPGTVLRDRPLPVFLVGEYRNEGKAKDRTVSVKLRADREGKPVGKPLAEIVKPGAVPEMIREWAAGVLDAAGGKVAQPDPKAEAKRLGELARVHRRLGNWQESLALVDASLLLDPTQLELRADAMEILPRRIDEIVRPNPRDLERLKRGAELHRRGHEHLEVLVTAGIRLPRHERPPGPAAPRRQFGSMVTSPNLTPADYTPEVTAIIQSIRDEETALYTRLMRYAAKQGDLDEELFYARRTLRTSSGSADAYARMERNLLSLQDLPGWKERARAHLLFPDNLPNSVGHEDYYQMLDRLAATGNADTKAAVAEARAFVTELERLEKNRVKRFDAEQKAMAAVRAARSMNPKFGTPLSVTDPDRLEAALKDTPYRHIRLTATPVEPDPGLTKDLIKPRLAQIRGILPAGPGIDVLWADGEFSDGTLYVMKEKGKLKRVFRIGGMKSRFTSVVFDGKYVWAAGDRYGGDPPVMIVLDPNTERVVPVTEGDGLPAAVRKGGPVPSGSRVNGNLIAELGPGRVCVAGSFGQAWVAVATYDPAKGVAVKVIHEAREAENEANADEWKKTTVAYSSSLMFTLRGDTAAGEKTPTRVLVQRFGQNREMAAHPLLIDPDAGTAEVMQDPVPDLPRFPACGTGRSVYVALGVGHQDGLQKEPRLLRIEYPGKVRDLGPLPRSANPRLHFDGKNLHVFTTAAELAAWQEFVPEKDRWWSPPTPPAWWVADADRKELTKLAGKFPNAGRIASSSHYGLVVILHFPIETALCAVTLEPPEKK